MSSELTTVDVTPAPPTCPKPGIYPGVSFADYLKIPAMNVSKLRWAGDNMAAMKAAIDGVLDSADSRAMEWGRAMHIRLLEPARYADAVHLRGTCESIIKSGERKGAACGATGKGIIDGKWYCGTHNGNDASLPADQEYLTAAELQDVEEAAAAVKGHGAEKLRAARGQYEVVMIAELMGVPCKCRLDKWIERPNTVVDCKKVASPKRPGESCTIRSFEEKIAYYGYGAQAGMYCDIVEALTGTAPRWFWLVVEDGQPHGVGVYRATDTLLDAGRTQYRGWLTDLIESKQSNVWPGLTGDVVDIDGPDWWIKENGGL